MERMQAAQAAPVGGLDRLEQPLIRERNRRRDRCGYRPGPELGPESGPLWPSRNRNVMKPWVGS